MPTSPPTSGSSACGFGRGGSPFGIPAVLFLVFAGAACVVVQGENEVSS